MAGVEHVEIGLAVFIVPLAIFGAIALAQREGARPARTGLPVRRSYLLLCAVGAVVGAALGVLALLAVT